MHNRINAQAALVGVALTALGVIFGFVVNADGSTGLLVAVPPLALLVGLLSAAESHRVATIGDYVRERLWPYLKLQLEPEPELPEREPGIHDKLPSWEKGIGERRTDPLAVFFRAVLIDGAATALFVLPPSAHSCWCSTAIRRLKALTRHSGL